MAYYRKYRAIKKEANAWLSNIVVEEPGDDEFGESELEVNENEMQYEHVTADRDDASSSGSRDGMESEHNSEDTWDSEEEYCEEQCPESSLQSDLGQWLVQHGITREAGNSLLALLRKHGHHGLPKDSRTLKKTPRMIPVTDICGGEYIYFGLKRAIEMRPLTRPSPECRKVEVQVNVDGVPLLKSSSAQFWPILCSVNQAEPVLVALYRGTGKPKSLDDYMRDFVTEMLDLMRDGTGCRSCDDNHQVEVVFDSVVCDAPARAFLKNITGHTSKHACERCLAIGVSVSNRVTFNTPGCFSAENRCSDKFSNLEYLGTHQNGPTPLTCLTEQCVSIFPLDYMHLICLGVVRRMINFWRNGDRIVKLSSRQILEISEHLIAVRKHIPSEFARRPRSLLEVDRWKATEFRQFLLYTGPVILKSVIPSSLYKHFLTLSVSISILLREDIQEDSALVDYADKLLHHFVQNSERLYGQTFVVFNVHNVLHVADDVKYFGRPLDRLSAFKYENYLQKLKRMIRSASNPLVQVAKRIDEIQYANLPESVGVSSRRSIIPGGRDSTVFLRNGQFATVIEAREHNLLCDIYDRHCMQPFYSEPCSSEILNIFFAKSLKSTVKEVDVSRVKCKGLKLPHKDGFVLMPMLHQVTANCHNYHVWLMFVIKTSKKAVQNASVLWIRL